MGMDGGRESFLGGGAGESSRGTAKTPPLQSGNAAMAMIGMDDTEQRGRHSIRLPGYDYGRAPTSSPYVRRGGCISSGRCGKG